MSQILEDFNHNTLNELSFKKQKEYIKNYFFPLKTGDHAILDEGKFEIIDEKKLKSIYFNRMPKELSKWYFTEYIEVRKPVYELNQPLLFDNKINLCPQIKQQYKKYENIKQETKDKVNILLDYIKEVLANGNEDVYNFILKWFANMLQGNKNQSCLYFKGEQGIGKSTIFEFLRDYVIGDDLFLESGSAPLKKDFNSILQGKLLVFFEELECFTVGEWSAISSKLKRIITSKVITIESKYQNSFQANNINNYAIASNNDAIRDDDGRRYFIADINNKRKGDKAYWKNIYDNCFNDKVGKAFFSMMLEIDVTDFNSQDFPKTKNKLDSLAKRLDYVEIFIKTKYVLKKKAIKCDVEQLFVKYNDFCMTQNHKPLGKYAFCNRLKELGINHFKSNDKNKYYVSYEELSKIAESRYWIHELDEYETKDEDEFIGVGLDDTSPGEHALREENKALKEEISKLKFELEQLKIKNEEIKKWSVPDPDGLDYYEDDLLNQLDNAEEVDYPEEYEFKTRKDKTQRESIEKMKAKLDS